MNSWQEILRKSITTAEQLKALYPTCDVGGVLGRYPMRINPYYLSLIEEPGDPIWKQAVPDLCELEDDDAPEDPLAEEKSSPVPNITHRYPDRVLFLISSQCAMYCRFCTRKRKVGTTLTITDRTIAQGLDYIRAHREIRDVILSGGDPLLLSDDRLEDIISRVRSIPHVEIIRIGTRVPCVLPQRVTEELCTRLKRYHPLFFSVHFNHPRELTPAAQEALGRLADAGIPLGNQTVLLKGVNDDGWTMKILFQGLLRCRVKPYYLYLADLSQGTRHFRTTMEKGLEIMHMIQGHTSGLAVPHYVVDTVGGGGKVPLGGDNVVCSTEKEFTVVNYKNELYTVPQA